ncbi:hypothetical protein J6590_090833, partial [Homalodisca vitripennis]
ALLPQTDGHTHIRIALSPFDLKINRVLLELTNPLAKLELPRALLPQTDGHTHIRIALSPFDLKINRVLLKLTNPLAKLELPRALLPQTNGHTENWIDEQMVGRKDEWLG